MSNEEITLDSSENDDLFTTTGLLKVRIVELVDVADALQKLVDTDKKIALYHCHFTIGICHENQNLLNFSSSEFPLTLKGSGQVKIGEEYLFHVSSTYALIASLHAHNKNLTALLPSPDVSIPCVGTISVPISRLGDGVSVVQWYQLISPTSGEGLRTAIKLELMYVKDSVNESVITENESDSFKVSPKSIKSADSQLVGLISPKSKGRVRQRGDSTAFQDSKTSPQSQIPKRSSPILKADVTGSSGDRREDSRILDDVDHSIEHELIIPDTENTPEPTAAPADAEHAVLHSGLVDYCFIVGPSYSSQINTSPMRNSDVNQCPIAQGVTENTSSISSDSDIIIWDRFPQVDYPQTPLPGKIEWFASPEGVKVEYGRNRPTPVPSTFMLSASTSTGETLEQFGACLTFFLNADALEACAHDQARVSKTANSPNVHVLSALLNSPNERETSQLESNERKLPWWADPDVLQESHYHNPAAGDWKWVGVTIVLLTRWPFLKQLLAILRHHYCTHLQKRLLGWEDTLFRELNNSSRTRSKYPQLLLALSDIIVKLCIDLPIPIPGLFSIRLNLPSDHSFQALASREKSQMKTIQDSILFRLSLSESLPDTHFSLDDVIFALGARVTLSTLCCALCQCRILFHSKSLGKLPAICDGIRALLYPFQWNHVYLPVVPSPLMDLFEAPVPFILGTHTDWLNLIPSECLKDVVIVDCDLGSIDTGTVVVPRFPAPVDRWLMMGIKCLLDSRSCQDDMITTTPIIPANLGQYVPPGVTNTHFMLQILLFDSMVNMLRYLPQCIFFLGPAHPVFNRPLFLEKFTSSEYLPFMEALTDTNAFHQLVSGLYSPDMAFFLDGINLANDLFVSRTSSQSTSPASTSRSGSSSGRRFSKTYDVTKIHSKVSAREGSFSSMPKGSARDGPLHPKLSARDSPFSTNPILSARVASTSERWTEELNPRTMKSPNLLPPSVLTSSAPPPIVRTISSEQSKKPPQPDENLFPDWIQNFVSFEAAHSMNFGKRGKETESLSVSVLHGDSRNQRIPYFSIMLRNIFKLRAASYETLFFKIQQRHLLEVDSDQTNLSPMNSARSRDSCVSAHHWWHEKIMDVEIDCDLFSDHSAVNSEAQDSPEGQYQLKQFFFGNSNYDTDSGVEQQPSLTISSSNFAPKTPKFQQESNSNRVGQFFGASDESGKFSFSAGRSPRTSPRLFLSSKENYVRRQRQASIAAPTPTASSAVVGPDSVRFRKSTEVYEFDGTGTALKTSKAKREPVFTYASVDEGDLYSDQRHFVSPDVDELLASSKVMTENVSIISKLSHLSVDAVGAAESYVPLLDDPNAAGVLVTLPIFLKHPVLFDEKLLMFKVRCVESWNIKRVCDTLGIDPIQALQAYEQILKPRADETNAFFRWQTLSPRLDRAQTQTPQTFKFLPIDTEDPAISRFFQTVITSSKPLDDSELTPLMHKCAVALESHVVRKRLMEALNSSSAQFGQGTRRIQTSSLELCQLQSSAFDALATLFATILQICTKHRDYLNAFALLEVAGRYFHVKSIHPLNEDEGNTDTVEVLSVRVCHHPIYQSSLLWRAIMNDRCPLPDVTSSAEHDHTKSTIYEVHNLLHLMFGIGVNADRALLFIQAIARDYRLDLNSYFQLQRFTKDLWEWTDEHNHQNESTHKEEAVHEYFDSFGHSIAGGSDFPYHKKTGHHPGGHTGHTSALPHLSFDNSQGNNIDSRINISGLSLRVATNYMEPVAENCAPERQSFDTSGENVIEKEDSTAKKSVTFQSNSPQLPVTDGIDVSQVECQEYVKHPSAPASVSSDKQDSNSTPPKPASYSISGGVSNFFKSMLPSSQANSRSAEVSSSSAAKVGSMNQDVITATVESILSSDEKPASILKDGVECHVIYCRELSPHFTRKVFMMRVPIEAKSGQLIINIGGQSDCSAVVPSHAIPGELVLLVARGDPIPGLPKSAPPQRALPRVHSANWQGYDNDNSPKLGTATTPFGQLTYGAGFQDDEVDYVPIEIEALQGVVTTSMSTYESWLVTGTSEGNIGITDLMSGKLISCQTHSTSNLEGYEGVTDVRFIPNSSCFVSSCSTGAINVWSLPNRSEMHDDEAESRLVNSSASIASSPPNGGSSMSLFKPLSAALSSSFASLSKPSLKKGNNWTIRRKKYSIAAIKGHVAPISAVLTESMEAVAVAADISSSSNWFLASGDQKGTVVLSTGATSGNTGSGPTETTCNSVTANLRLAGGAVTCFGLIRSMGATRTSSSSITASPMSRSTSRNDGRKPQFDYLGIGTDKGLLEVIDLGTTQSVYRIQAHTTQMTGIISIRSHELLTYGRDRTIKLWDLRTRHAGLNIGDRYLEERVLGPDNFLLSANGPITAVTVGGQDNSLVLAGSADGIVRIWDLRSDFSIPSRKLKGHKNSISSIQWNDIRGSSIQTASFDGTVCRWDSITGSCLQDLTVFRNGRISMMATALSDVRSPPPNKSPTMDAAYQADDVSNAFQRHWLLTLGTQGVVKAFKYDKDVLSYN